MAARTSVPTPAASARRMAITVWRSTRSIGRPMPRSDTSDSVATSSDSLTGMRSDSSTSPSSSRRAAPGWSRNSAPRACARHVSVPRVGGCPTFLVAVNMAVLFRKAEVHAEQTLAQPPRLPCCVGARRRCDGPDDCLAARDRPDHRRHGARRQRSAGRRRRQVRVVTRAGPRTRARTAGDSRHRRRRPRVRRLVHGDHGHLGPVLQSGEVRVAAGLVRPPAPSVHSSKPRPRPPPQPRRSRTRPPR